MATRKARTSLRSKMQEHLGLVGNATVTALSIVLGVPATTIRKFVYDNPDLFVAHRDDKGYMLRVELVKRKGIHIQLGATDADDLRQEDRDF